MEEITKKRYAFIDVQNTEGTVNQLLDFSIDWSKTYQYLKEHWKCNEIFFYSGIQKSNVNKIKEYESLLMLGYKMRVKTYSIYKNQDTIVKINCNKCNNEISHKIDNGTRWKSNCDVEFSVDVENNIRNGSEFLFFTGDGDFEYLIRDVVNKGIKVYIISSAKKTYISNRYYISRFSTKLRDLIAEKRGMVDFLDINDWKNRIYRS
jgi:uncharacterized LabA/DUF88 family protein